MSRTSATYAGGRATGSLAISAALKPSVERPSPSRGRGRGAAFPSSTGSTSESGSSSSRRWTFSRVVMFTRVAFGPPGAVERAPNLLDAFWPLLNRPPTGTHRRFWRPPLSSPEEVT